LGGGKKKNVERRRKESQMMGGIILFYKGNADGKTLRVQRFFFESVRKRDLKGTGETVLVTKWFR